MEQLVQRKLATAGPQEDKLAPFRQQATVIRRNKESSAARVHELAATLKEHEATLADLQSQVPRVLFIYSSLLQKSLLLYLCFYLDVL